MPSRARRSERRAYTGSATWLNQQLVGVIAESIPGACYRNDLDTYGILLAVLGLVLFIIEWWSTRSAGNDELKK